MTSNNNKVQITLPCSSQHDLTNPTNDRKYRIQISWPLNWERTKETRKNEIPVIYILDGNAMFLTATETLWRNETMSAFAGGIIVAIGYQIDPVSTGMLYDRLRDYDLTPPKPQDAPEGSGGANALLDFIQQEVKPLVKKEFPDITIGKEAIFGHSYGGLFALHTMFTRQGIFDTYIAASPSIWWSDKFLLGEEEQFYKQPSRDNKPTVLLSYGELENEPKITAKESEEQFEEKKKRQEDFAIGKNAKDMYERLKESGRVEDISITEFEGEDHLSVVGSTLNRGLTAFFNA